MKPFHALAFAALVSTASAAEIPAGTHLLLRMENSVTSRTAKAGDGVYFRTVTPLSAGGRIVVPPGSYAQGIVTRAERAKQAHGQAGLEIQLVMIMLTNGEVIAASSRTASISSERASEGASNGQHWDAGVIPPIPFKSVFGAAAIGAIAGGRTGSAIGMAVVGGAAVISSIVARGHEVELRAGTQVDVAFDRPVVFE
jgi:hypothetical protein